MRKIKLISYDTKGDLFIITIYTDSGIVQYNVNKVFIDNSSRSVYTPSTDEIKSIIGKALNDIWCYMSYSFKMKFSAICIELDIDGEEEHIILFDAPVKYITGIEQIVNIKNWS